MGQPRPTFHPTNLSLPDGLSGSRNMFSNHSTSKWLTRGIPNDGEGCTTDSITNIVYHSLD